MSLKSRLFDFFSPFLFAFIDFFKDFFTQNFFFDVFSPCNIIYRRSLRKVFSIFKVHSKLILSFRKILPNMLNESCKMMAPKNRTSNGNWNSKVLFNNTSFNACSRLIDWLCPWIVWGENYVETDILNKFLLRSWLLTSEFSYIPKLLKENLVFHCFNT